MSGLAVIVVSVLVWVVLVVKMCRDHPARRKRWRERDRKDDGK